LAIICKPILEQDSLDKVKARTKHTEILWVFFGIHTANAVKDVSKVEKGREKQAA
jgi:hypothetical protein